MGKIWNRKKCLREKRRTWTFEEEQTENGGEEEEEERKRKRRCATKQNLSRSLSSAITVETSLFLSLSLFSLSPIFSLLRLERGNQRE